MVSKGEEISAEDAVFQSVVSARLPEANRWLEKYPSVRVPLRAVVQSVDFHAVKHYIPADFKLSSRDITSYFEMYYGSPTQMEIWNWFVESLGLVFDAKEWQDPFSHQTVRCKSVFNQRYIVGDINPSTWEFLISLGFTPTKEDYEGRMDSFTVASLAYLEENFPDFIEPGQLPLVYITGNLPLVKFYFRKFPQEAVAAITDDVIVSIVDMQSVHILDYLFEKAPQKFKMDFLFMASLSKLPTWSTELSDFSGFQWLVDHGAQLNGEHYVIGIRRFLPSKWFLMLYDNNVKAPQDVFDAMDNSRFVYADDLDADDEESREGRETRGVLSILKLAMKL